MLKDQVPSAVKSTASDVTSPQAEAAQNNKWDGEEFRTLFTLSKCETLIRLVCIGFIACGYHMDIPAREIAKKVTAIICSLLDRG